MGPKKMRRDLILWDSMNRSVQFLKNGKTTEGEMVCSTTHVPHETTTIFALVSP